MKLFVRRMGQGNPVIILHGLLGLSDNWVSFGRQLARDFEVFIPDLRNHGQSPRSTVFNFTVLADDLLELIEEHNLVNPCVIGHSLGGKTAMLFALTHPDRLSKLVIVDIALRKYSQNRDHKMLIEAMLDADLSIARSRSDVEHQLESSVHSLKLRQFLMKNLYWKDKETLDWRLNLEVLKEALPGMFEGVTPEGEFQKPALFVRGGLSDYVLEEDYPGIIKKFPGASVITIDNASHWVHADAPGEFYNRVHDFFIT
ncbi:MAG: alpha/beta fold hydrolase [Bacteroidetes bacterium]|nr:alpha/beta fold hydrolase [Bacteroidota bacterium]